MDYEILRVLILTHRRFGIMFKQFQFRKVCFPALETACLVPSDKPIYTRERGVIYSYTTFLINQNILVCQGTSLCSVQCIWSQRIHFLVFFALAKVSVLADLILNQYGCNLVGEYGCNLVVVLSMCLSSTVHEKTDIQQCSFDITTLIYWEQNKDV